MATDIENSDLRLLSLLHALGDKEEWSREAVRLLLESNIDEAAWARIRRMGCDIAPKQFLFNSNKSLEQLRSEFAGILQGESRSVRFDRRQAERRIAQRRSVSDRRLDQRRTTILPWLGSDRRDGERRQSVSRQT